MDDEIEIGNLQDFLECENSKAIYVAIEKRYQSLHFFSNLWSLEVFLEDKESFEYTAYEILFFDLAKFFKELFGKTTEEQKR